MIVSLFIILPALVLLIISGILLVTAVSLVNIFKTVREPIFIHVAIIFAFLFLSFLTGAIGVYLTLDETSHPIFLVNIFAISMTYIGVGFVYRNLSQGISITTDYLHILLLLAPSYAVAMMLGLEFSIIPALVSQFIPLIIVLKIDLIILSRIKKVAETLDQENDVKVLKMFEDIFSLSRNIHFLGILSMFSFSIIAITGQEFQVEETWGPNWQLFDYLYFVGLLLLLRLFFKIYRRLIDITDNILNADLPTIINSLLD